MKTLSFTLLLLSLLASVLPMSAHAVRVDHLFEAEVAAGGRDADARDAALAQALDIVLLRLTGGGAALQQAHDAGLLAKPGQYVEQYRFRENPGAPGHSDDLRLWVQFDGVSLARDLRQAGLPYWGPERPDVLVWLAIDDRGRRYLAAETGTDTATGALLQAGRQYGLPLTVPLMDLQDQQAVSFADVWGQFSSRLDNAAQRYRPQAVLTARLDRSGDGWRGEWQLADGGERRAWRSHGDDLDGALDSGIAAAAAWLAQRYAVVATATGGRHTLVVENVRSLDDFARTGAYLASLSPVDRVDVVRAGQHSVEYSLALNADTRSLLQLIALGRVLQRIDDPAAWRFRLQP